MMFIGNFAALSFAGAAAFVWARALDTASGTSTLPIPTTVITCIQQCFDQAELQSGCNGPNDTIPCLCASATYLHVALGCLQAACPPDIESALQTYTQDCGLGSSSGSSSMASTTLVVSATSVSPSSPSGSGTNSTSSPPTLTATTSPTALISQTGGSSASATVPPSVSGTASETLSVTASAVSASTHAHTSNLGLLVALPLTLALAFIAALALLWRRARLRGRQQHEDAAMFQPHSLPPPSEVHSPASASSPSPLLKRAERPPVLAPAMASVAPSAVHSPTSHGSPSQYGVHATGDDAQREGGREAEAGAEERVMVLPWSLGERVLALLGGRHGDGSRNDSAVVTEALPPYEERDERM